MRAMMLGVLVASVLAAGCAQTVTDQQTGGAMVRGAEYLLTCQQADGSWAASTGPAGRTFPVGESALATWALLAAGEDVHSQAVQNALDYLQRTPTDQTYSLTARIGAFAAAVSAGDKTYAEPLERDVDALVQAGQAGHHGYRTTQNSWDNSNSEFGAWGVSIGQAHGIAIPKAYWLKAQEHWVAVQNPDGGWGYQPGQTDSRLTLTAAGVVTLDRVRATTGAESPAETPRINRAVAWLTEAYDKTDTPDEAYVLLLLTRLDAAGYAQPVAGADWRARCAMNLLTRQRRDGSWKPVQAELDGQPQTNVTETALAILFLACGT